MAYKLLLTLLALPSALAQTTCSVLQLSQSTTPSCKDLSGGGGEVSQSLYIPGFDAGILTFPALTVGLEATVDPCASPAYVSASAGITFSAVIPTALNTAIQAALAQADTCLSLDGTTLTCEVKAELGGAAAQGDIPVVAAGVGQLLVRLELTLTGNINAITINIAVDICADPIVGPTLCGGDLGTSLVPVTIYQTSTPIDLGIKCPPKGLSSGAIAGVVIGSLAGVALLAAGFVWWRKRKHREGGSRLADPKQVEVTGVRS